MLLSLLLLSFGYGAETLRLQVGGEWCWVKLPPSPRKGEAVIAIHGNGQTVGAAGSSWEDGPGFGRLTEALLAAGYIVAQSNHGATADNGMWGNAATQRGVIALAGHLRRKYGVKKLHAVAVSAGNATLMNLALDGGLLFETALLVAPVLSLESMYRCPGGMDRVKGLADAFGFRPSRGCPGDPAGDAAFRTATAAYDPLRRLRDLPGAEVRRRLGHVRWMSIFNDRDPRVLPAENIRPVEALMKAAGVPVRLLSMDLDTHSSDQPLAKYEREYVSWLQGGK